MSTDNMTGKILTMSMGLLATISLGLAGWALASVNKLQQEIVAARANIGDIDFGVLAHEIEQITQDHQRDDKQDETLAKHWQLHSWERDEINKLRVMAGADIASWPAFHD